MYTVGDTFNVNHYNFGKHSLHEGTVKRVTKTRVIMTIQGVDVAFMILSGNEVGGDNMRHYWLPRQR